VSGPLHFDAFAGEADEEKPLGSTSAVLGRLVEIEPSVSWSVLATTSSAGLRYAGLGYCHLSNCNFVGFAGSFLRRGSMGLAMLVGWRIRVAVGLDLQVIAIAGSDRSRCKTLLLGIRNVVLLGDGLGVFLIE
jgi:hypothetical protein